jgi:hypothetical protein
MIDPTYDKWAGNNEPAAPFDIYAVGDSVLLCYHLCTGHRQFCTYEPTDRTYTCISCGATHPDRIDNHDLVKPVDYRSTHAPHFPASHTDPAAT